MKNKGDGDLRRLVRLTNLTPGIWWRILLLLAVSLSATPLALLAPVPLKIAVDSVLGKVPVPGILNAIVPRALLSAPNGLLLALAAMSLVIVLLAKVQNLVEKFLSTQAGEEMVLNMRALMFRRLQFAPLAFHDRRGSADSIYRIQTDALAIRSIIVDGLMPFIASATTFVSMIYVIVILDWEIAAVAMAVAPALVLFVRAFRPRLRRQAKLAKGAESRAMGVVQEVLGSLRTVKAFRREQREHARFVDRSRETMRQRVHTALSEGHFALILGLLTAVGSGAVLFVGVAHVQAGQLSLGSFLLIMGYVARLYDPLTTTARKIGSLQTHLTSLERAFTILEVEPDLVERSDALPIERARGEISMEGVSFCYPDGHRSALESVSFHIAPGERVGIVGPTGSGKSTLINLLMRFYDPNCGIVRLDGVDLRDFRLDDVRRQFAYVPQDPVLFSVTIGENIAFGVPAATREQIATAAAQAHAASFIEALPQGYDTPVGERGVTLSGGERQRIALARAFLLDAPIIVLDEPTSALDARTEAEVAEALDRLKKGRTVIVVSHRPSAIEGCTTILHVDGGRLQPPSASGQPKPADRARIDRSLHPAVTAWQKLRPECLPFGGITPRTVKWGRVRTLRLEGALEGGGAVVAKWSPSGADRTEQFLYERVLPKIGVGVPSYFGSVDEESGEGRWEFTSEVRGEDYRLSDANHRLCAARWLAALHSRAREVVTDAEIANLPDAGSAPYLLHLKAARPAIQGGMNNTVLTERDRSFLAALLETLDLVEERWPDLERESALLPPTLVHGDFAGRNIRIVSPEPRMVVFDWEMSGWGSPAPDLAQLSDLSSRVSANADLREYAAFSLESKAGRALHSVERLAMCGTVFRVIASLDWRSANLGNEWAGVLLTTSFRLYHAELIRALERLGWSEVSRMKLQVEEVGR